MNLKIIIVGFFLVAFSTITAGQTGTQLNITDPKGLKQGHWIKKYPNGNIMYDGYFKDDHPTGEFKRYFDDNRLMSLLIYSPDGKEAEATIYHPNGNLYSKGKYVKQMKEGKWQFFSAITNGYLICEEVYTKNLRSGPSLDLYPDSTVAERVIYINDIREGEWTQYYPNGRMHLKSYYKTGKLNGKFEVWFENGGIEFSGQYKEDARDGTWHIFNKDGSVKYQIEYEDGITKDRKLDIDESDYLDSLELNKGKIADPEKTGIIK